MIRAAVGVMAMIVAMMVMAMMIVIMMMHICIIAIQDTDMDALAGNHRLDTSHVIFRTAFERDQKARAVETDTPVQIARVIAELNRIGS